MFGNFFKKKKPPKITADQLEPNIQLSANTAKIANTQTAPIATKHIKAPVSFLKNLTPIDQLTEQEIQQLSIQTANFSAGSIVFNRGSEVDALVYLVKGSIFMEANTGAGQEINAGTLKALFPLSTGEFHQLTAIAKTHVVVLYAPTSILQPVHGLVNSLHNEWRVSPKLQNNSLFKRFYAHYQKAELQIPSFPDVALKLRRTTHQDIGIVDVVKIINLDPVIAAKLIQVVNSPIYRAVNPITNCHDAVNRLGLNTTRNLATAFSMKNLIRSKNPIIKKRIQETWMQSVRVSGISHTLARLTRKIDPEEALLAGLLHNIGALPILMFADSLPAESYTADDINLCINELQGPLGSVILEKWEFPDSFKNIPLRSSRWFDNTDPKLCLNDIVLLAKFHNLLAYPAGVDLPLINTLPAFQKLNDQPLTPEMSLQILHDAKQQIAETMKFFVI